MELSIITEYIVIMYGIGIPIFFMVRSITLKSIEKRQLKDTSLQYSPQQNINPSNDKLIQKYTRITEVINNDNMSANDRITILKSVLKK